MNELSKDAISAETVAAKFAAAGNLTNPDFAEALKEDKRIGELMWFFQKISTEPGGVNKFVASIVTDFAPSFGLSWLHDTDATPTLDQRLEAWKLLPEHDKTTLIPPNLWENPKDSDGLSRYAYPPRLNDTDRKKFNALLSRLAVKQMAEIFLKAAKYGIPEAIITMCKETLLWQPPQQLSWDHRAASGIAKTFSAC